MQSLGPQSNLLNQNLHSNETHQGICVPIKVFKKISIEVKFTQHKIQSCNHFKLYKFSGFARLCSRRLSDSRTCRSAQKETLSP